MADDRYLQQRMKEESANIKVDSYQKVASLGGWKGAGRTLWAISIIAAAAGASMGVVAPFFPLLVGASSFATAVSAIPTSVAAFTTAGIGMGFSGGLMLGRVSGAASAVAQEQEKRMKEWTARQILHENPSAHIIPDPPEPIKKPERKSFFKRLQDGLDTYVNLRVAAVFAAVGLAAGLIMAAAFISTGGAAGAVMPALGALTGMGEEAFSMAAIKAAPAVLVAYTAGVTATFGALFGLNFPKITSEFTMFTGDLLSGKSLGREWGPRDQQPAKTKTVAEEPSQEKRRFSSFTELVTKQATERSPDIRR